MVPVSIDGLAADLRWCAVPRCYVLSVSGTEGWRVIMSTRRVGWQFKNGGSASRVRAGPAFRRRFLAFLFWLAIGYVWRHMSSLISTIEVYSRTYGSRPPSVSTNRCCPATARTTRATCTCTGTTAKSSKAAGARGKKTPGGRELHVHVCATITTGNFMLTLRVTYLPSLRLRMFVPHTSLLSLNAEVPSAATEAKSICM